MKPNASPAGEGVREESEQNGTGGERKLDSSTALGEPSENMVTEPTANGSRDGILSKTNSGSVDLRAKLSALKRDHLRAKVLASIAKKAPKKDASEEQD